MDWHACCGKRIVKEVQLDDGLIKSLIKSSKNKLTSVDQLPLNETTASSKLSLAYDSLRELLEALSLQNEIRIIRNKINYYGAEVSVEEVQEIILNVKNLKQQVEKLI